MESSALCCPPGIKDSNEREPAHWIIGSDSTSDVPWLEKNRESRPWRMRNIFNSISTLKRESKCSSRRGCPARKHVERSLEDPSMLVVAYEGEHNHSQIAFQSPNMMLHI
ncbi:hypothetical protein Peur_015294 [Populus x canadensis]